MKTCSGCKEIKELNKFHKCNRNKDGLQCKCIVCKSNQNKKWRDKHIEEERLRVKKYEKEHPNKIKNKNKRWQTNNIEKEKTRKRNYQINNKGKCNAIKAKYHAQKLQATPNWLTEDQLKEMDFIYNKSATITKETGIKHQVDHIVPLQGKTVSGLHVPWNLQVITAEENKSKGNKLK